MSISALASRVSIKSVGIALLALALTACAQTRTPGYYATSSNNTESDARMQADGRATARAPSQIQLGFGDREGAQPVGAAPKEGAAPERLRPLTEAKTFLGTVPCLSDEGGNCPATRVTLTLAPTGEWRARSHSLDASASRPDKVEQGCWQVIGAKPPRILLQLGANDSMADLTFVNDNVLRINMFNNIQPKLEYRLTRQANIDAIDELAKKAPLSCD